ncbi:MAG: response regulator [Campylobacterota bacterium]|nr:response regulator [Campylobacterota bacterium]
MKILIVDDSVTVRLYHKQILQGAGYEIDEAENGMEALEKVSENSYDLFLVDINMPILDGYSFVRRYRENSGYDASIVMISTESDKSDRTIAYEAGANFYEVKPVSSDDLLRVAKLLTIKCS